ncbi:PDZ domain-containing protein [Mucilaginibacter sp. PAMB04274]|uniref:PDZ domain-containing protein n=1 Tax=Mucilaginibacter sp. PAMB04274 TaxID=3138568 RepID=UPI0031F6BE84
MKKVLHICKCLFLVVFVLCQAVVVKAQYFDLVNNKKQVKLRFRMVRDMIIVPVTINSKGPFNFVLDSGVGLMIITDPTLVDSINIYAKRTIKLYGSGNADVFEAYATSPLDIMLDGKIKSYDVSAAILKQDHFGLSNYAGMPIHGLLGYEFFSQLAVKINFSDSTITAGTSGRFKPLRKGIQLPISIEERKPYLKTTVTLPDGCPVENKFVVDLGAGHPLSLENLQKNKAYFQKAIVANLGVGLTGPINGYISRVNEVNLGKYKFNNVITSFPDSNLHVSYIIPRDGNIGLGILKKFLLVLDYQKGIMYLKPNYKFKEPFEHDMSGMEYYATGADFKRILISRVEPGSAADEAGITANDEITAINFKAVTKMNMIDIDNLFKSREKRNILVEISRDKKVETVILTLKRRI